MVGWGVGWAVGGAFGALVGGFVTGHQRSFLQPMVLAGAWGLGFLLAGYIGLVAAMYGGEIAQHALSFLESQRIGLMIGWALGAALGGALAPLLGIAAQTAIHKLKAHHAA